MGIGTSGPVDRSPEPAWTPAGQAPAGWAPAGQAPAGWAPEAPRSPSGLFPAGPPRPRYREPHPVRMGAVLAGVGGGVIWLTVFGLLGGDLAGRVWWVVAAGGLAWLAALVLLRAGDRGVAVGLAAAIGVGWAITAGLVVCQWLMTADWPLW